MYFTSKSTGDDFIRNVLEKLRREAGYTQQELASRLSVSRQTVISLESGRYSPSLLLAHRIAELFGKKIEDIFIFEDGE